MSSNVYYTLRVLRGRIGRVFSACTSISVTLFTPSMYCTCRAAYLAVRGAGHVGVVRWRGIGSRGVRGADDASANDRRLLLPLLIGRVVPLQPALDVGLLLPLRLRHGLLLRRRLLLRLVRQRALLARHGLVLARQSGAHACSSCTHVGASVQLRRIRGLLCSRAHPGGSPPSCVARRAVGGRRARGVF